MRRFLVPASKNVSEVLLEVTSGKIRTKSMQRSSFLQEPAGTSLHDCPWTVTAAVRAPHSALVQAPWNWEFLHSKGYQMWPSSSPLDWGLKQECWNSKGIWQFKTKMVFYSRCSRDPKNYTEVRSWSFPYWGPLHKCPNDFRARRRCCLSPKEGCYQGNAVQVGGNTGPLIEIIFFSSKKSIVLHTGPVEFK